MVTPPTIVAMTNIPNRIAHARVIRSSMMVRIIRRRFEAMRTLVAAVDGGSLSAASRSLGIPLPTVSRVSDLETLLGSQLVVRTSRNLLLTEAGTAYVASARRVLEELSEAERAASGEYRAPRGELLVTAPIMFGTLNVAPIVHDFLAAYPEVAVRLVLSDWVLDLVESHIDVALRIGRLPDSALIVRRVGEIRWMVCASPGAPPPPRPPTFPTMTASPSRNCGAIASGRSAAPMVLSKSL
jgi:DNA-binding transcriptional LysR family regulator